MRMRVCQAGATILFGFFVSAEAGYGSLVDSKIVEVTVHADRARVTRSANVQVPEGVSTVEIGGLTTTLDERTVEVSGQSSGQVTIQGVDLRQEFLMQNADQRAAEVQRKLDELLDQKRAQDAQVALLDARQAFFKDLKSGLGHSDKGVEGVDELKKIYDFYLEELTTVSDAMLEAQGKERDLQSEIDRTKRELSELSQQRSSRRVAIGVQAAAASELTITLRYTVHDALWEPIYDARLNTSDGSVLLIYNAQVRQKTGEDWNNVKLSVSTARPGENGQLPELNPDYLSLNSPQQPATVPEPRRSFAEAAGTPVPEEHAPRSKVKLESANLQTSGLAVTYSVLQPVSIPSDNQPHQTNLKQIKMNGELTYICTPRLELAAFVKERLTNSTEDTLLAGSVNLFRDGDLIGSVQIPETVSGAEFDLFAGRDDAIKIERKELATRQAETGFLNRRKQKLRKFQITVQNHRKSTVKITVYDQLPVAQDSQISVTQGQMSEKPAEFNKDTGQLTWNLTLNANEKKVIEFEYTVEWPGDRVISGLD